MRVELLGPVRVDGDAEALARRDRVVLAVLAVHDDGPVTVDLLTDALWGQDPPASHAKVVHGCISRLRKRLGADAIATLRGGYRLELDDDEVDVRQFEQLLARGRELSALGEADRAAHVLGVALGLWSGDAALPELDDWEEGRVERQRLRVLREDTEELWVDALLGAGRPRQALSAAANLVEAAPLREARWVLLARAQYQCGRQAEALATISKAREVLARELGLDPGPALVELQERMLRQDDSLTVPDALAGSTRCPYPGLLPFDEDEAESFLGREAEVAECLDRLARDGVLVVAGPSGSGKSSLVRAGVAAACRRRGQNVRVVTASAALGDDLSALGPRPDLLVVDQLEELTAPDLDRDAREAALSSVAEQQYRSGLVLVVRGDRLGELADSPVASVVERGLLLLGGMTGDALRRAVVGPADHAGLLVEPGLVDLLVTEVEGEPGALPLLAHVLRSTWERREGRTLTVAGYRAAGGVRGAIAQSAEAVHHSLAPADRRLLRDLLLRLVAVDEDRSLVAASVPIRTVDDDSHRHVLDRLVEDRLVTVDDERVHLAHEALTRAWPRLRVWLDEDVAGQRILRHVTVTATAWDVLGRPDSELYRGVRLDEAVAWRMRARPHLTPVEQEFLDVSVERRDRARREEQRRAARTERTNRRLRRSLRVATAMTAVAVVAGAVAGLGAWRAERASVAADARRVGAQALLDERIDRSLLLAAGAVDLDPSADTRASLLTALGRIPELERVLFQAEEGAVRSVAVSADGTVLAVQEDGVAIHLLDAATGEELASSEDGRGQLGVVDVDLGRVAFHPTDGPVAIGFATSRAPAPVTLLEPDGLAEVPTRWPGLDRPGTPVSRSAPRLQALDLDWSDDGERLAAVVHRYEDTALPEAGVLVVLDLSGPTPRTTEVEVSRHTRSVEWGADDLVLHTATATDAPGSDPTPRTTTWDAGTLEQRFEVDGVGHPLATSHDGQVLAVVEGPGDPGTVVLLDAGTGEVVRRLDDLDGEVRDVEIDDDGRIAAASGSDVVVWDLGTGAELERLRGHAGAATSVAFVPGTDRLVTAGVDGAVLAWDLDGSRRLVRLLARAAAPPTVSALNGLPVHTSVSPDGSGVAYVGALVRPELGTVDGVVQLLDVASAALSPPEFAGDSTWQSVVWDGTDRVLTIDPSGEVFGWHVPSGEGVKEDRLPTTGTVAGSVGDEIAQLHWRLSVVHRVDPRTPSGAVRTQLVELEELPGIGFAPYAMRELAVAPDDLTVATFGGSPAPGVRSFGPNPAANYPPTFGDLPDTDHLLVVDVHEPALLALHELGFHGSAAAFGPSGERIAVVGRDGSVAVYDRTTAAFVRRPLVGHEGRGTSVVWVDEGRVVATGGADGRVALWDGATAEPLGSLTVAPPGHAAAVGHGPTPHEVVVATTEGVVFSLDTRFDVWMATACRVAGRSLDESEWASVAGARARPDTCRVG